MNFNDIRIGYVPFSKRFSHPADRRRFCYYAQKRNIKFETAKPSEAYDLIVLTENADLSVWYDYHKGKAKIIYDLIDSYLSIPRWNPKDLLRGVAKYVTRQSRYLRLDYRKAIEEMCKRADAVICTTDEQKQEILHYCKNVHIILDIHNSAIRLVKTDYSSEDVFNFVWEGFPENIETFYEIREVFKHLKIKHNIALHVVTDLEYGRFMRKYWKVNTKDVAHKFFNNVYIYEWNEQLLSTIITACDMALIPIPLNDPLYKGKPENKLLLFWRMGVPTVVSATPAYERTMQRCSLPMACRSQEEWIVTLEKYIVDKSARQEAGQRGRAFVEENYSEEKILASWDNLFSTVLGLVK